MFVGSIDEATSLHASFISKIEPDVVSDVKLYFPLQLFQRVANNVSKGETKFLQRIDLVAAVNDAVRRKSGNRVGQVVMNPGKVYERVCPTILS